MNKLGMNKLGMTLGHHHIYFPRLHISVAWRQVTSRLAAVFLAALVAQLAHGGIPQSAVGVALCLCAAAGAVILAAPDAFQAAGLLRPTSPDTVPLVQGLAQAALGGIQAAVAAPAARRAAAFQEAVKAGVQDEMRVYGPVLVDLAAEKVSKTNMTGFAPAELGQKEPEASQPAKEAASGPTLAVGAQMTIPTPDLEAAIQQTGGNQ